MFGSKDQFYQTSPSRILEKASAYSKTLKMFHQLPRAKSKSIAVSQVASNCREDIEYAVSQAKYQLNLFRNKEQEDQNLRTKYGQKLRVAEVKVHKNEQQIVKKKVKKAEEYDKHLVNTYKRYQEEERRHRDSQRQQSYKLRKQLQQFYQKEEERKKIAEHKQVHVGTQYQKAVDRINRIHHKNQEFSLHAEIQLNKELRRNNHSNEIQTVKRRALSAINQQKQDILNKSVCIFDDRQAHFIQKYGSNEDGSIKAWKCKQAQEEKTKKRLAQFFKKRVEKWSMQKKRVDEKKAQVPQKCLNILDKTSKSAFSRTVSTFRSSSIQWEGIVKKNKSLIKERDELLKDEIMTTHLDLRLKNNSSFKINEKMGSMKQHAQKIANAYL